MNQAPAPPFAPPDSYNANVIAKAGKGASSLRSRDWLKFCVLRWKLPLSKMPLHLVRGQKCCPHSVIATGTTSFVTPALGGVSPSAKYDYTGGQLA